MEQLSGMRSVRPPGSLAGQPSARLPAPSSGGAPQKKARAPAPPLPLASVPPLASAPVRPYRALQGKPTHRRQHRLDGDHGKCRLQSRTKYTTKRAVLLAHQCRWLITSTAHRRVRTPQGRSVRLQRTDRLPVSARAGYLPCRHRTFCPLHRWIGASPCRP